MHPDRLLRWLQTDSFRICLLISLLLHAPVLLLVSPRATDSGHRAAAAALPVRFLPAAPDRPADRPPVQQNADPLQPSASVDLNKSALAEGPYNRYIALLRRRISLQFCYPAAARAQALSGSATLRFSIARDGSLAAIRVTTPSGHPLLDRDALATVRRAAPFDAFPVDFDIATLQVTATFCYDVTRS